MNDNEARADRAMKAVEDCTDYNHSYDRPGETTGLREDVGDLLGNLMHLCHRHGLDWGDMLGLAERTYSGDVSEDGGLVGRTGTA